MKMEDKAHKKPVVSPSKQQ
jgi:hypothetical protein